MSLVSRLASTQGPVAPDVELARCFLRLCNLPNYALDRLSRYEAVKPGRLHLRSTIWFAASHMRECDVRLGGEQASRQFAP